MSTITARSVRRQTIKSGKHPDFPNGLPGHKRGTVRKITLLRFMARAAAKVAIAA